MFSVLFEVFKRFSIHIFDYVKENIKKISFFLCGKTVYNPLMSLELTKSTAIKQHFGPLIILNEWKTLTFEPEM